MNAIDGTIVVVYLVAMVGLSAWLGRGQTNEEDYYVGGRNLPWWAVGISTMATQTSAVSFISIPAFVALQPNGGLVWLQYELAVPLAMIAVMVLLVPFFRRLELVSVYEYLELRFDRRTRLMVSGMFLLSRGLGTGVGLYASGLVLEVCLGIPLGWTLLLVGAVTILYDTLGGMAAVVWSDVVQLGVLVGGLAVSIAVAMSLGGGWEGTLAAFPAERLSAIGGGHGFGDGAPAPMAAYILGGLFLYASYYGVDQSQAQRALSAPTEADTHRSLVLNGIARFPLTLLYVGFGVTLWAALQSSPELQAALADSRPDYLVPQFIRLILPTGVRALLFAALLAAAMSSLDSALNSLSAATMRDFLTRPGQSGDLLKLSRVTTVGWGIAITGFAFLVEHFSGTVVESINKVGSAFFGPLLAAFVVGVLTRRASGPGVRLGLVAGLALNVGLWLFVPSVFWMWWNVTGFVATAGVAIGLGRWGAPEGARDIDALVLDKGSLRRIPRSQAVVYAGLVGWFLLILGAIAIVHQGAA